MFDQIFSHFGLLHPDGGLLAPDFIKGVVDGSTLAMLACYLYGQRVKRWKHEIEQAKKEKDECEARARDEKELYKRLSEIQRAVSQTQSDLAKEYADKASALAKEHAERMASLPLSEADKIQRLADAAKCVESSIFSVHHLERDFENNGLRFLLYGKQPSSPPLSEAFRALIYAKPSLSPQSMARLRSALESAADHFNAGDRAKTIDSLEKALNVIYE